MNPIKKLVPQPLRSGLRAALLELTDGWATKSYSQEGEDMVLRRLFEGAGPGFYVDVGAHHPKRFSNTYHFYCNGWRGINIDARPGSMEQFNRLRPRDLNLEAGIAREPRELTYYMFNEPALNTFDGELARARDAGAYRIVARQSMQTRTLGEILAEHLPEGQGIEFLTVDVEGLDQEVLESNDWERFRPGYVLAECAQTALAELEKDAICRFMSEKGYAIFAKTLKTVFYARVR